jgi:hypothetical protein
MPHSIVRQLLLLSACLMLSLLLGCGDDSTKPEEDNSLVLPALTAPESLISAIQVIYNDKTHPAEQRLAGYASLFDTTFIFHVQPADVAGGLPPDWGLDGELAAHEAIFRAQDAGTIHSLELRVTYNAAQDLTPPEPGRDGWKEVFATNVYLRLMFNIDDGLEVNGGQGEFKFPPARNGRYWIADWTDLPRPGLERSAVENSTWGSVKGGFLP